MSACSRVPRLGWLRLGPSAGALGVSANAGVTETAWMIGAVQIADAPTGAPRLNLVRRVGPSFASLSCIVLEPPFWCSWARVRDECAPRGDAAAPDSISMSLALPATSLGLAAWSPPVRPKMLWPTWRSACPRHPPCDLPTSRAPGCSITKRCQETRSRPNSATKPCRPGNEAFWSRSKPARTASPPDLTSCSPP